MHILSVLIYAGILALNTCIFLDYNVLYIYILFTLAHNISIYYLC